MKKNNSSTTLTLSLGTIGFTLFIVFLVLKLSKVIVWNWFWVFFPLWLPIAIYVVVFAIIFIVVWITDR